MRGLRLGVVRPRSVFGKRIRELLEAGALPVIELKLFESEIGGETTLTGFGGDVVVTEPLDADLLPRLDALFVAAEGSDALNRIVHEAALAGVWTFVEGAVSADAAIAQAGALDALRGQSRRLAIVPRASSYFVALTLRRIAESFPVEAAAATVLIPAMEQGEAGAEELHQQVVSLLNFKTPPREIFHDQLAFNLLPSGPGSSARIEQASAFETGRLSGLSDRIELSLVRVPVFHAYSMSIWLELGAAVNAKAVSACFRSEPFVLEKSPPTPLGVAESDRIHVGPVRVTGREGGTRVHLWVVADTAAYDSGTLAIALARELLS